MLVGNPFRSAIEETALFLVIYESHTISLWKFRY